MNPEPRIVIAGSRALPAGIAPRLLVRFLAAIPERSVIRLRGGLTKRGSFETQVADLCALLGLTVEWCIPPSGTAVDHGEEGYTEVELTGRERTFARDRSMIADADLILCFHTPEQIGDEGSGTAALVEKALQFDKVVYAYAVDGETVQRVGEIDPNEEWSALVPVA